MSERFFVAQPVTNDRAMLEGPEAHHLAHVMRVAVGDLVTLFDGSGCEFAARVETIRKSQIEVAVLERRDVSRESAIRLTLAVALPKGDRQRWLVEKAVELGVATIVPLATRRGVAQPTESALERLRRAVIEASKQCGRNRLLEIGQPQDWHEFVRSVSPTSLRLVAHPGGRDLREAFSADRTNSPANGVIAAVGPEGGFTDDEIALATADGWKAVNLGPRTLRVETAAIALAVWAAQI